MATDYKKISENPRINYRSIFTPYSDKTHFIYELVQNADDNKSRCIELRLYENELLVWNDGRQFTEGDVRSICSIGFSNKDLTQIGTFGMGFKAVYAYTDNPKVYSGDERFRISINNPTKPEGIDVIDAKVLEQLDKGRTVFCLPFRKNLRQEEEIERLKDRLCDLEKRALLFLRNLKTVQWYDEKNGQKGSYSCQRRPHDKIQNASVVELGASINGAKQSSETFLVFRKEVQPPQTVIDELLQQSEDDDERQRIQKSAKKLQPIEVAFRFQDNQIVVMSNSVLFSYFPTEKETHLQFLIQASYKTTLARDNLEQDNQWNEWLIRETARFFPEVLEQLKTGGLLKPTFFNVLPLKRDVPNEFLSIAKASQKAMQNRAFIPTEKDRHYTSAKDVFYPNTASLRKLVKSSGMHPDSSLLHPDIQDNEKFRRGFEVIRDAGMEIIRVNRFLSWLEKQSVEWFEARSNEWLHSLYVYFKEQAFQLDRIKKLPLVRLENGGHVSAANQSVYFPPDERTIRDTNIKSLLNDFRILHSILLEGEERHEIEAFLKNLGVTELDPEDLIREAICPLYHKSNKPSIEQNCRHVRYIFKVWQKGLVERSSLEEDLRTTPIIQICSNITEGSDESLELIKKTRYVTPSSAYLSKVYTGDTYLETYFSYDSDISFVDNAYLENKPDTKDWLRFLKAIGVKDTPLIFPIEVTGSLEECEKRGVAYEYSTKPFEDGEFKDIWSRRAYQYFDGHIMDRYLDGLSQVLVQIDRHNEIYLPQALWGLLVKLVHQLPSEEGRRNDFFRKLFQGTYRWFYRSGHSKFFNATFYRQLESTPWVPDGQGKLYTPSECFAPTSENRKLLGDSVVYLPADFDISTEPAKWLAERLGVQMEADAESVLRHLHQLKSNKEVNVKKIEPLYRFLYSVRPRKKIDEQFSSRMVDSVPEWRSKFKMEPLIFIPNSERNWWQVDEVFWKDEGVVFGDTRGYLKSHYAKDLKSFFTASLAVSERATASDYVNRIQRVKSMEQVAKSEIQILYERLWRIVQESNSGFSNQLDVHPRGKFGEESLIFAPNSERCWWQVKEVFWENEGVVFGNDRGYLKSYYPETLKPFFTALGVSERAAPLDYVSGIKEVASIGKAESSEIRKRIKRLYSRVWQSLQEGGTWQESEKWKQTRESKCWFGKKGSEWGFFSRHELVWNDHHDYIAEIFEGEIPFWIFDDLWELAQGLEIEGCSQAKVEFHPEGDQDELTDYSKELRNLRPYIHAFLNSPRLCEAHEDSKSARVLDSLAVSLVEELETMYTLKGIPLTSPNPRPSFLDVTNQKVTLWLALEADKDDYALLIGDALQDYFGVKDLGRFIEHLLTKTRENVLNHWKREGLRTELCVSSPEIDAKESETELVETGTEKLLDENEIRNTEAEMSEFNVDVPMDSKVLETDGEKTDSMMAEVDRSENRLSNNQGSDATRDESEDKTLIDSETLEIDRIESDSISEKSETYTDSPLDVENISSSGKQVSTKTEDKTGQPTYREYDHDTPTVNESP